MPPKGDAPETRGYAPSRALRAAQAARAKAIEDLQAARAIGIGEKRLLQKARRAELAHERFERIEEREIAAAVARAGGRLWSLERDDRPATVETPASERPRLRGEPPARRQRRSQRERPRRIERERMVSRFAASGTIDPESAHAQAAKAIVDLLPRLREEWSARNQHAQAARVALSSLTKELVLVVNEQHHEDRAKVDDALALLHDMIDQRYPASCASAEDLWLLHADEELDDDEIAKALWPNEYPQNRSALLERVRSRRREIQKRRELEEQKLLDGLRSATERRAR